MESYTPLCPLSARASQPLELFLFWNNHQVEVIKANINTLLFVKMLLRWFANQNSSLIYLSIWCFILICRKIKGFIRKKRNESDTPATDKAVRRAGKYSKWNLVDNKFSTNPRGLFPVDSWLKIDLQCIWLRLLTVQCFVTDTLYLSRV